MTLSVWPRMTSGLQRLSERIAAFLCLLTKSWGRRWGGLCRGSNVSPPGVNLCCINWPLVYIHFNPGVLSFDPQKNFELTMGLPYSISKSSFSSKSSKHHKLHTIRARKLKFWEDVHPPPCVTFPVSHVTRQVSGVTCHMSHVMSQVSRFYLSWTTSC